MAQMHPKGARRGSCEGGFTLFEIILVLGFLGLLLTIVIPRIGLLQDAGSASRTLIGLIHTLKGHAVSSQQVWRLHLDLDQGQYWVTAVFTDGERIPLDPKFEKRFELPVGVKFERAVTVFQGRRETGTVYLQIFPNGYPEAAIISLRDQDGNRNLVALHVSNLTGQIRVSDVDVDIVPLPPLPEYVRPLLFPEIYGGNLSV
jgi:type II secretory pathway pseudopilin PulG